VPVISARADAGKRALSVAAGRVRVIIERLEKEAAVTVHTPTVEELEQRRHELSQSLRVGEAEARRRIEGYQVTAEELETLRRIDEVDYLLGR